MSEERWKSIKAHPVSMLESWKGSLKIHSSYGWSENRVTNLKGATEIFLTGYVKVDTAVVDKFLQISGKDAVFVDKLAKDQKVRPNVCWHEKAHKTLCGPGLTKVLGEFRKPVNLVVRFGLFSVLAGCILFPFLFGSSSDSKSNQRHLTHNGAGHTRSKALRGQQQGEQPTYK